jgi:RecJ-like exonuclease
MGRLETSMQECPECGGEGLFTEFYGGYSSYYGTACERNIRCEKCDGKGVVPLTCTGCGEETEVTVTINGAYEYDSCEESTVVELLKVCPVCADEFK